MEALTEALVTWARRQPEILAIYLYGSVAEGRTTVLSDIDFAILVQPSVSREAMWRLEERWAMQWPEAVDLRILNQAPLIFQYEVTVRGRRLWAADVNAVAEWESSVWRRYWDVQPRLAQDWRLYVESLMEKQDAAQRQQYQAALAQVRNVHRRVRGTATGRQPHLAE